MRLKEHNYDTLDLNNYLKQVWNFLANLDEKLTMLLEETYKECVHEFNLHLRAVSTEPERVDHAGAIIVEDPGTQQVEQYGR